MDNGIAISPSLFIPLSELSFAVSRSGGPGGQHVNKTETRVELLFDVVHSPSLTDHQRAKILHALANRIDGEGVLHITVSQERSQMRNKHIAMERFREILARALAPRRKRVATKPSGSSREKRLRVKKVVGEKKKRRHVSPED
jgi:ribosome-associated protein